MVSEVSACGSSRFDAGKISLLIYRSRIRVLFAARAAGSAMLILEQTILREETGLCWDKIEFSLHLGWFRPPVLSQGDGRRDHAGVSRRQSVHGSGARRCADQGRARQDDAGADTRHDEERQRAVSQGREGTHAISSTNRGRAPGAVPRGGAADCIDSRAPAEVIMKLGIGDIFNRVVDSNVANADVSAAWNSRARWPAPRSCWCWATPHPARSRGHRQREPATHGQLAKIDRR